MAAIIVYPTDDEGGRRVRLDGTDLGRAFGLYEVMDLLERAGLGAAAGAFEDTDVFEWRGGGPYSWGTAPGGES
ncbi:hypothetical protein GCM10009801_11690 [Streptomyces albiaxialis]|uniref:Uncharacterized protein n=1 Tax=Streptomyces albiaxialis TaxID=329523 RepID=A0ABN2VMP3_9ACTN